MNTLYRIQSVAWDKVNNQNEWNWEFWNNMRRKTWAFIFPRIATQNGAVL
jgi:hypothetical protein